MPHAMTLRLCGRAYARQDFPEVVGLVKVNSLFNSQHLTDILSLSQCV